MTVDRRRVLTLLGGSVVAAAALSLARIAAAEAADPAAAPWFAAGTPETDPRRAALAYAILAPNPHNRQPWRVRLTGTDGLMIYCDPERRLPVTDPFDRQITIGLGAFTELLVLAAAEQGFRAEVTPFPEGEPGERLDGRAVASVRFVANGAAPDPLFVHVLARRSNKAPYDMARPVAPDAAAAISGAAVHGTRVNAVIEASEVARVRDVTIRGMVVEMENPESAMESIRLLRIGQAEVNAMPDGIDLTGPMIEDLHARGILTREAMAADMASGPGGPLLGQMVKMTTGPMHATPGYLWQATAGNGRVDHLAAGRDWVRVNLAATGRGLAVHPQSQALQEFAAMAPLRAEMRETLGARAGETVQMLARIGYGPVVPPSPRWPMAAALLQG